jgi:dTDP-4-dehydrorhamnose reductase
MKRSIMVLGATGMLGHQLVRRLAPGRRVVAVSRLGFGGGYGAVEDRLPELSAVAVAGLISRHRPDAVVNAIGLVKQRGEASDPTRAIAVNSLFPHVLADACATADVRLIHFSTDCVFSGRKGCYTEEDTPDAEDLYGRSKLLGEVSDSRALTLRTSMIGPELSAHQGLLEWAKSHRGGSVQGYRKAIFSGLPTVCLADLMGVLVDEHPGLSGLYHVAADPISKDELLHLLNARYDLRLTIEPTDVPVCDRSLNGARFCEATGFVARRWPEMIDIMAQQSGEKEHV